MRRMPRPGISLRLWTVRVCQHMCPHTSLRVILRLIEIIWEEVLGCMVFLVLSFFLSCFLNSQKNQTTFRKVEIEGSSCSCPVALSQNSQCGSSGLIRTSVDLQTRWDCPFLPISEGVEVMQDRKPLLLSYLTTQKLHWCPSSELSEFPPAFWWDLGFTCLSQGSQFIMGLMVLSGLQCKVRLAGSLSLEVTVWRSGKHLSVMCFIESRMLFPRLSCTT